MLAAAMGEAGVLELLSSPEVQARVGALVGTDIGVRALDRHGKVFAVAGSQGEFVVRFPKDESGLHTLRREERLARGLQSIVPLRIPNTQVIEAEAIPAFALYRMIPGKDWFGYCQADFSPQARSRLVMDLVDLFLSFHSIPLCAACEWLGIDFKGEETRRELALREGKPGWFAPNKVIEMRKRLRSSADHNLAALFEETAQRFAALEISPDDMVFGHGDLHGGNVAMVKDAEGPRLVGVFDLECTGILDVHHDFCRLNLISDDLQDRVIAQYQAPPGCAFQLNVERIEIYSRAFLLYLIAEQPDADGRIPEDKLDSYHHLVRLLEEHVEHYNVTHGALA